MCVFTITDTFTAVIMSSHDQVCGLNTQSTLCFRFCKQVCPKHHGWSISNDFVIIIIDCLPEEEWNLWTDWVVLTDTEASKHPITTLVTLESLASVRGSSRGRDRALETIPTSSLRALKVDRWAPASFKVLENPASKLALLSDSESSEAVASNLVTYLDTSGKGE